MGHCHDWRRLWVLSDNVLGKYSTWTSSIYLQENRNLWLLTMFYLFKLTRLQFCNYCWAIRTYSHTCDQALSFSVLADLSHMLYIEKQVHFVPVAEFAVTLLRCTLLTIILWPCNWLHLYVTGMACMIVSSLVPRPLPPEEWPGTHGLRMRIILRYILRKKHRELTGIVCGILY